MVLIADLAAAHGVDRVTIGFAFGPPIGIRLGRPFAPPKPRSKWISDEYKRLKESNRRDAQRYVRRLLKAQTPPKPKAPSRKWNSPRRSVGRREAGRLGRQQEMGEGNGD